MVSVLMVLGGTLCGIEEEAVAFYPILVPIFIAMGYDSIICVGAIFLASSVGSTFSTVNPFSVVIASNAAGTTFVDGLYWRIVGLIVATIFTVGYLYWYAKKLKDPKASYTYEDKTKFENQWSVINDDGGEKLFTLRKNHFNFIHLTIPNHGVGRYDTRLVVPNHGLNVPSIYNCNHVNGSIR